MSFKQYKNTLTFKYIQTYSNAYIIQHNSKQIKLNGSYIPLLCILVIIHLSLLVYFFGWYIIVVASNLKAFEYFNSSWYHPTQQTTGPYTFRIMIRACTNLTIQTGIMMKSWHWSFLFANMIINNIKLGVCAS